MPAPVPQAVLEREALLPGMRLCYRCDTLQFQREFSTTHTRECRGCRSKRALGRSHKERIQGLHDAARHRAKRWSLPFTIKVEDIVVPELCPVFGMKLEWGTRHQRDHSPSVDRIRPELGYTKENIIVVSWLANNIKGKFTVEQLRKVADFYALRT